jgi:regulator of sigma E protease
MEMILGSIFWFLVATSLLVTFHEFGHFWVARRCGVKVLRFSIGLGKPLWSRRGADGTEYVIAAIPLGGYVKMLDEREADVDARDLDRAFNRKSLGRRIAIVAAGPIFNLIFAVAAFWLMLLVGVRDFAPYIGEATGLAARSGLERGDLIMAVDERPTSNWTHVLVDLTTRAYRGETVPIEVRQADGNIATRRLNLGDLGEAVDEERFLAQLGLQPWHWMPPATVYSVREGDPAMQAGVRAGDVVVQVGDTPVDRFGTMSEAIQKEASANAGRVRLQIDRNGIRENLLVQARSEARGDKSMWIIGVTPDMRETTRSYGPIAAVPQAFVETWRLTVGSLRVIQHMVTGQAQWKNISGPLSIAQFANYSAEGGFTQFLRFLGLISLSLCIMNLLPIPILDGGHLLYYFIEWVKGSPLSDRAQAFGQYLGLGALLALMCLAFFNDISRLMPS